MNYTYILTCADGTYYCGWTNDLDKRVKDHNQGRGAKYTRPRRPVVLSYYEEYETKQQAMKREYAIKRLTRADKEKLVGTGGIQMREPEDRSCRRPMPQNGTSGHNGIGFRP